jgi:hypothetical protein
MRRTPELVERGGPVKHFGYDDVVAIEAKRNAQGPPWAVTSRREPMCS